MSYFLRQIFSAAHGAEDAQGIMGRTPPHSAARAKSRQAKTPTQAGGLCIHITYHFGSLLSLLYCRIYSLLYSRPVRVLVAHLSSQKEVFSLTYSGLVQEYERCVTHTCCSPSRWMGLPDTQGAM